MKKTKVPETLGRNKHVSEIKNVRYRMNLNLPVFGFGRLGDEESNSFLY
jgi:hypothetical protein